MVLIKMSCSRILLGSYWPEKYVPPFQLESKHGCWFYIRQTSHRQLSTTQKTWALYLFEYSSLIIIIIFWTLECGPHQGCKEAPVRIVLCYGAIPRKWTGFAGLWVVVFRALLGVLSQESGSSWSPWVSVPIHPQTEACCGPSLEGNNHKWWDIWWFTVECKTKSGG